MKDKVIKAIAFNNVFITGGAGVGKTYLLNQLLEHLAKKSKRVLAVAPTGMSAKLMNGSTIHYAFKLPFGSELTQRALNKIVKDDMVIRRLRYLNYLIVDEISMVSYLTFTMMDQILRAIRGSDKPFGGIKLIVVGDFFQLPPIVKDNPNPKKLFAFQSDAWRDADIKSVYLTKVWRAKEGDSLITVLNAIRESRVTEEVESLLESKLGTLKKDHTILFTHNMDVDKINNERLAEIDSDAKVFGAKTVLPRWAIDKVLKSSLIEEELTLKVGAKVMMIRNNPKEGYVNGSTGTIYNFNPSSIEVMIDGRIIRVEREDFNQNNNESEKKKKNEFLQYPIKLGWAITIHKSQGMTLSGEVYMDLSRCFEVGQGYVALSRLTTLDNLILGGLNDKALQVSKIISKVDPHIKKASKEFLDGK